MLTAISLFLLRRHAPVNAQPFRVPLYPVTPLLFVAACAFMLYSSFNYAMSLDPGSIGAVIGICAESHCRFRASLAFPDAVDAGLRVRRLGRSSVTYEIGLFRSGEEQAAADGDTAEAIIRKALKAALR